MSDEPPIGVIVIISFSLIFGIGVLMSGIGDSENYETGRNAGIIFCTENKKSCTTEYNYLKLKVEQE